MLDLQQIADVTTVLFCMTDIVNIFSVLSFAIPYGSLSAEDVENVVNYVEGELTDQDLIKLGEQLHLEEKEDSKKPDEEQKKFTAKGLASVFSKRSRDTSRDTSPILIPDPT